MPVGAELIPLVKALRTSDELKDTLVFQVRNLGPVGIHSVDGVVQFRIDLVIRLKCCVWTITNQQCIESVELSVVGVDIHIGYCQISGSVIVLRDNVFQSCGIVCQVLIQTVEFASALLIMDEPTAGLDVEARNEILDMLRAYIAEDESRSILITSHISTDLESLCDELYLIHDGKLILHEATDAILEQYGILKVSEEQYRTLDQSSILKVQKENYGYACFTNDKKFYQENYPQIAVENGGIDELILMMTGGYR